VDISELRERRSDLVMSVSELNSYIKNIFESDRMLTSVSISGEISNFVNHRSGHLYFSLKDDEGQIRAVMFRSSAVRLKFIPENGMKVTVRGSVSVYTKDGSYQIYVSSMQPDGIGALFKAYEALKERLYLEGLFSEEHKKSIPKYPSKIGVITSPTGAAVRDIINVLSRRYPIADIYLYPALVQGASAAPSLIEAVDYFDRCGLCDVVIIGRGGGSIEDLWAFNDEALARRIYDVKVPIISAVGHEIDFTICDFVSDLRAPTPSAAAELAVPDIREIIMSVSSAEDRCVNALRRMKDIMRERFLSLADREVLKKPEALHLRLRENVEQLKERAGRAVRLVLSDGRNAVAAQCGRANALSPLSVLSRGYSVAEKNGKVVKSSKELSDGDELSIRFSEGSVKAKVTE